MKNLFAKIYRNILWYRHKQTPKVVCYLLYPDHLHILVSIAPDCRISDLVRDIKANSSSFIKQKLNIHEFHWQKGYGAFSYSKSQIDKVVNYILNQPLHHKTKTFRDEYVEFLKRFEIDYKEEYLFEFYQ